MAQNVTAAIKTGSLRATTSGYVRIVVERERLPTEALSWAAPCVIAGTETGLSAMRLYAVQIATEHETYAVKATLLTALNVIVATEIGSLERLFIDAQTVTVPATRNNANKATHGTTSRLRRPVVRGR